MTSESIPLSDLSRGPAAKFEKIGDTHAGRIVSVRREQQREFETGKPMEWQNGDPIMQLVIIIDTPTGEETLYARGGKAEPAQGEGQSMEMAIATAAREAGASAIDAGAELAVRHSGVGKPTRPGFNGMKLYVAQYKPPAPQNSTVAVNLFDS